MLLTLFYCWCTCNRQITIQQSIIKITVTANQRPHTTGSPVFFFKSLSGIPNLTKYTIPILKYELLLFITFNWRVFFYYYCFYNTTKTTHKKWHSNFIFFTTHQTSVCVLTDWLTEWSACLFFLFSKYILFTQNTLNNTKWRVLLYSVCVVVA